MNTSSPIEAADVFEARDVEIERCNIFVWVERSRDNGTPGEIGSRRVSRSSIESFDERKGGGVAAKAIDEIRNEPDCAS